jgi:glycosyltransferase involved in cell wall biosynthesis
MLAGARTLYAAQLEADLARLSPQERQKVILRYDFPAEEKPWLFAATDVFAYPSGFESFGIAFLEAWAVKKPVVGCRRGAIPWVVSAGKDGLLVPEGTRPLHLAPGSPPLPRGIRRGAGRATWHLDRIPFMIPLIR